VVEPEPQEDAPAAGGAARHAGLALAGNLLNQACFLLATVLIARGLGREQYGVYASAMALSIILSTLAAGGLDVILVREMARTPDRAGAYLGGVILLKVALTALVLLGLAALGGALGMPVEKLRALWFATLANLVRVHERTFVAAFRALGRMALEGVVLAVQGVLYAGLVLALAGRIADAGGAFLALLLSYLVSLSVGVGLLAWHGVRPGLMGALSASRFLGREALPVGVGALLAYLYERLPVLSLEALRGSSEVALFSSAFSLVRNTGVVPLVLAGAALPSLSRLAPQSRPRLEGAFASMGRLLFALALPLAIMGWAMAEPVMGAVFGSEYVEGYRAFRVLSLSVVAYFLTFLAKAGLEATDRQGRWTAALALGVVAGAALQVACVSWLGHVGAGLALVAADLFVLALAWRALQRRITLHAAEWAPFAARCLLSGGALAVALWALGAAGPAWRVLAGAAVYGGALLALRAFSSEEIGLVRAALTRRPRPGGVEALAGHGHGQEAV